MVQQIFFIKLRLQKILTPLWWAVAAVVAKQWEYIVKTCDTVRHRVTQSKQFFSNSLMSILKWYISIIYVAKWVIVNRRLSRLHLFVATILKFIYSEKATNFSKFFHQLFVLCTASQIIGGDFAKFCGFLRIYEL